MTKQPSSSDSPSDVIAAFLSAMNTWELACWDRMRAVRGTAKADSHWDQAREDLMSIHAQYLTPHQRVYAEQPTFQKPPRYDPGKESVIASSIDGKVAIVQTMRVMGLGGGQFQYKLQLIDSCWRIDNVKKLFSGKWQSHIF